MTDIPRNRAPFIWIDTQPIDPMGHLASFLGKAPRDDGLNRWYLFRNVMALDQPVKSAPTRITVDGRYKLFVNGAFVGRGPVRSTPFDQKYDCYDLASYLKPGRNIIGVLIHVFGEDKSWYEQVRGMWRPAFGDGGLWIEGAIVSTDKDWRAIKSDAWDCTTPPANHGLGFIESFDARTFPEDWLSDDFDDSHWHSATILKVGGGGPEAFFGGMQTVPFPLLFPNPLPPLAREFVPVALPYWIKRLGGSDLPIFRRPYEEVLLPLADDKVSETGDGWHIRTGTDDGVVMLFDMGKLHTGSVCFTLDAAGGEEIEIAVNEQLPGEWEEGGPTIDARITRREVLGLDAHVTRYTARPGLQNFERFEWQAVKWLQISIRNAPNGVTLSKLGLMQTHYPVEEIGEFTCSDPMLTQLWSTGAYTLKLCMHDGWEDCPSREQRQWLGDATVENLVGHVAFGPSVIPLNAKYLKDAAASQRTDGLTQMFAPGNHGGNGLLIPDWTLQWILNAREHLRWAGDLETIEAIYPSIQKALAWFEAQINDHGLIADMPYWHFIDWSGVGRHGEALPLNAQLAGCFDASADMADALQMSRAASRYRASAIAICESLNNRHWDEARGIYVDCVDPLTAFQELRVSQHGNAAMILWGGAPENRWRRMIERVSDPARLTFTAAPPIAPQGETLDPQEGVVLANTFYSHFVQCAFIKAGRADLVLDLIRNRYGPMLHKGATTLWESFAPTASLCHGFSATPTYQLVTGLLGLQPSADGFASVRIAPLPTDLSHVECRIGTVVGELTARLDRNDQGWTMKASLPDTMAFHFVTPHGFARVSGLESGLGGTHEWHLGKA
jgi:alpha-L-rhamnosidase